MGDSDDQIGHKRSGSLHKSRCAFSGCPEKSNSSGFCLMHKHAQFLNQSEAGASQPSRPKLPLPPQRPEQPVRKTIVTGGGAPLTIVPFGRSSAPAASFHRQVSAPLASTGPEPASNLSSQLNTCPRPPPPTPLPLPLVVYSEEENTAPPAYPDSAVNNFLGPKVISTASVDRKMSPPDQPSRSLSTSTKESSQSGDESKGSSSAWTFKTAFRDDYVKPSSGLQVQSHPGPSTTSNSAAQMPTTLPSSMSVSNKAGVDQTITNVNIVSSQPKTDEKEPAKPTAGSLFRKVTSLFGAGGGGDNSIRAPKASNSNKGADVNAVIDAEGRTALIQAAEAGNLKLVKLLVEVMRAEVTILDKYKESCKKLHRPIHQYNPNQVVAFLKPLFGLPVAEDAGSADPVRCSASSHSPDHLAPSLVAANVAPDQSAVIRDGGVGKEEKISGLGVGLDQQPEKIMLEQLFARVVNVDKGMASEELRAVFWLQYPCFSTADEVLSSLEKAFSSEIASAEHMRLSLLSKIHIVTLLLAWIKAHPGDLSNSNHTFLIELTHPPSFDEMYERMVGGISTTAGGSGGLISSPSFSMSMGDLNPSRALLARLRNLQETLRTSIADLAFKGALARTREAELNVNSGVPVVPTGSGFASVSSSVGLTEDVLNYLDEPRYRELILLGARSNPLFIAGDMFESKLTPLAVAQQLCLMDQAEFATLGYREFINKEWTRKEAKKKSPNILRLISVYNMRSNWAASLVLESADAAQARARLTKMVQVVLELQRLQNFFSCSSILSGLGMTPVHRLRPCWDGLGRKMETAFDGAKALFESTRNYNTYRTLLKQIQDEQSPHVLNLSTLTKDMFQLEELETWDQGLVNWNKFIKQHKSLNLLTFMTRAGNYPFVSDPWVELTIRHSQRVAALSEDAAFERSYMIVPKSEEHTFKMNWRRLSMEQKLALLEESKKELNIAFQPIEEARLARAEREAKLRQKEDEKLSPFQQEVDRIAKLIQEDKKAAREAEAAKNEEAVQLCLKPHMALVLVDGKFQEHTVQLERVLRAEAKGKESKQLKLSDWDFSFYWQASSSTRWGPNKRETMLLGGDVAIFHKPHDSWPKAKAGLPDEMNLNLCLSLSNLECRSVCVYFKDFGGDFEQVWVRALRSLTFFSPEE